MRSWMDFYASQRQLRAWEEGAAGGRAAGPGVCSPRLPPPTLGLALRGGLRDGPGPAGAAQEEHLLLLRTATAAGLLLDIYSFGFVSVYFWSQKVRRLDDFLLPRRLWRAGRGGAGKEGPALLFLSSPWQLLGWRLGWKDCCCCWLLLTYW